MNSIVSPRRGSMPISAKARYTQGFGASARHEVPCPKEMKDSAQGFNPEDSTTQSDAP